jgi:hypothetical protein
VLFATARRLVLQHKDRTGAKRQLTR